MPFPVQVLEPRHLSRDPLNTKLGEDHWEAVFNGTAANVIRQLGCLTAVAHSIFTELTAQLKEVQNRTEKLREKVSKIDVIVTEFDPKQVPIPAGSLDEFSRLKTHFVSSNVIEKCLFTINSRPRTVKEAYKGAVPSPVHLVRTIDPYRKDGQRSSSLFLCMPFFKDRRVPYDVDIEMRRPASLSSAAAYRGWQSEGEDDILALDTTREDDGETSNDLDKSLNTTADDLDVTLLPTPAEKIYINSLRFPQEDVAVDVTGTGFRRMSSLRRSFIHQMEQLSNKRRKKKRRTKPGEQAANEGGKVNEGAGTSGENTKTIQKRENKEVQTNFDDTKEKSGGIKCWFQRRARNRNSIIGGLAIYEELDRVKKNKQSKNGLASTLWLHGSSAYSSSSCSPSKSSTDSAVATGTSSVSDTNLATLKPSTAGVKMRANGKGYRTKREDGGQSSSGNWSASSSTRTSMESEDPLVLNANDQRLLLISANATLPRYTRSDKRRNLSHSSSRKESLASEKSYLRDRFNDSSSGYLSDGPYYRSPVGRQSLPPRLANSATVTARWLRSLEEEGIANGPLNSETTDATSSTGTVTPRAHRRHRPLSPMTFVDDGESSEFSVDTDGYYTSMHTDSGLRQYPITSQVIMSRLSDLKEHGSNSTLSSDSSERSSSSYFSSKKATTSGEDTSNKDSNDATTPSEGSKKKKTPPPPPPRRTNFNNATPVETSFDSSNGEDDASRKVSTASDSDADGDRLKSKTKMNSDRIPAMCLVTPSASDEDEDANSVRKVDKASSKQPSPAPKPDSVPIPTPISSYNSFPKSSQDIWSRDQRAYRTLPRNYSRETQSLDTKPDIDENRNKIFTPASNTGARVTLDQTGKVIHNYGSLPRKFTQSFRMAPHQRANLTNNQVSKPVPEMSNGTSYSSNTFPRWKPTQSGEQSSILTPGSSLTSPAQSDASQRRWNFMKRDPSLQQPIGAYVRMDGHPQHLEPGRPLSRNSVTSTKDESVKETTSSEELSTNNNVPAPPAAMPLLQNTNYAHVSRIPTRSVINSSHILPSYYSPANGRTSTVVTTATNSLTSSRPTYASINKPTTDNKQPSNPNSQLSQPKLNLIAPPYRQPPSVSSYTWNTSSQSQPRMLLPTQNPQSLAQMKPPSSPLSHYMSPNAPSQQQMKLNPTSQPTTYSQNGVSYQQKYPVPSSQYLQKNSAVSQLSTRPNYNSSVPPYNSAGSQVSKQLDDVGLPTLIASKPNPVQRALFPSSPQACNDGRSPNIRPLSINTSSQRLPTTNTVTSNCTSLSPRSPPQLSPSSFTKSSMTTDELFAAIHNSKKKLNIKVDSNSVSPNSTSRSNSPLTKSPTPTPPNRPETGTLSPSPSLTNVPAKAGDRRSWAMGDSTPIESRSAGDRRSWASDRLGPSKPTSMHDFKMLLLHAGRGSSPSVGGQTAGTPGRKSAAEMLKTGSLTTRSSTPTNSHINRGRMTSSSTIPGRSSSPKTLVLPLSRSFNSRIRGNSSVLHNRTDILSTPIPEDEGSEEDYETSSSHNGSLFSNSPLTVAPSLY